MSEGKGDTKIPGEILAFHNQPGWHGLPSQKVYVVCGKSQRIRKKVTPGPQHKVYGLRTTWQLHDMRQQWDCIEHRVKWKNLTNPHEPFSGTGVRAIMLFEQNPGASTVARVGDLLVDTGACTSVRRPDAIKAAVDPTVVESLYSVDDSPLHACGEVRPHLTIGSGQSRQEAQIVFQVVEGITDNILSINRAIDDGESILFSPQDCYIQWPDGSKATFERKGRQFVLPYREKDWASRAHVRIAPVVDPE